MSGGHTPMRSILEQARMEGWRAGISLARQVGSDEDYQRGRHDGLVLHAAWGPPLRHRRPRRRHHHREGIVMAGTRRAVVARFDGTQQHRRAMLAKVHIAKKTLGMVDDDYEAVLIRVAGRASAGDCTQGELEKVLKEFERMGFSAQARPKGPRPADHPAAAKARAMWISLGLLGAIGDTSEKALESFGRRQLHCDRLQWANQALVYKLIEALKAIAERHGWRQSVEGLPRNAIAINLKRRLCEALLGKLWAKGDAPATWDIQRAAYEFAGVEIELLFAGPETLDLVARAFGAVLAGTEK